MSKLSPSKFVIVHKAMRTQFVLLCCASLPQCYIMQHKQRLLGQIQFDMFITCTRKILDVHILHFHQNFDYTQFDKIF